MCVIPQLKKISKAIKLKFIFYLYADMLIYKSYFSYKSLST